MPSLNAADSRRRPPAKPHLFACAVLALLTQAPSTARAQQASAAPAMAAAGFVLPAQPLDRALEQLARQAGLQLMSDPARLRGVQGRAVSARELPQALSQLLQGSGMRGRVLGSTILVEVAAAMAPVPALSEVRVVAAAPRETATGPLGGQIARRSATATKTDTPLVEIPQSISIVTREELQNRKSDTVADALEYTAGFSAQPNGFSRVADDFTLRGFNVGPGTGGLLRDGMKLQSSVYDGSIEPYGLERVEVLKGAASVLYGQLSPGGLINTVSKRPTDTPLREVGVATGSFDRKQAMADLGGPIDEEGVWSWRLTALARDSGTDVDHVQDNRRYLAPALTWQPNAATSVTALASVQQIRSGFAPPLSYNITRLGANARAKVQPGQFVGEPGFDRFDSDMQTLGYLLRHDFNDALTLRHALRRFEADLEWDYSQVNASVSAAGLLQRSASIRREHSTGTTSDTSLEWRSSGQGAWQHTMLAGVDTYDKRYISHRFAGAMQPINLLAPVYGTAVVPNLATDNGSDLHSRQWGVYLQDQIKFEERWVLLAGLRHDSARSDTTTLRTGGVANKDDSKTTGRAGLVYLAPNGLAPYLSYSQSFFPADGIARNGSSFVPTEGEQWEAGMRWQPAGSQTLLSAALYRLTQNNALTVDPVDSRFNVQTGQVRSQGLELEARQRFSSALSVRAAYTYTDARTTQDNRPANVGQRIVGVPRHALALWGDYQLTGIGLSAWRIGAGLRAQDHSMTTSPGTPTAVPGYGMLDLMLGWAPDVHWDLTVRVQNAADRSYVFCNTACRYGNARTTIATLNYRW